VGSSFRGRKTVNNCWDDELEGGGVSWAMAVLIASSTKTVVGEGAGRLTQENRRGRLGFSGFGWGKVC
jgi:hypothetical protein